MVQQKQNNDVNDDDNHLNYVRFLGFTTNSNCHCIQSIKLDRYSKPFLSTFPATMNYYIVFNVTLVAYITFIASRLAFVQATSEEGGQNALEKVVYWRESRGPREKLVSSVDFNFWKLNTEVAEIIRQNELIAERICILQRKTQQLHIASISTSIVTIGCVIPMAIFLCLTSRKYLELTDNVY